MPFDKHLHDLLENPFGPYLEDTVLSHRCKFTASKRLLLEDFQLAYNDEPMGFDRTEFEGNLTPFTVAHLPPIPSGSPVLFRGILSLQALPHLSEEGQKHLSHDFQERAMQSAINGVLGAKKHSNTDMAAIFTLKAKQKNTPETEKYNIKLLIQGYMHSTASFMRSEIVPDGLLFHASNANKTKFRVYQIVSMDIETYKLSRTFLFRHHTLRTLRDILGRAAAAGVPASQCITQWFIDQYLGHHAYPPHSKWQRINFLEGVESSDEGFSMSVEQTSRPSDALTHIPRHPRRVHKNEVWSIFASHSEWILSLIETHRDLKNKVNTQSWKIFFSTVSQLRQSALSHRDTNGEWGIKDEEGIQMVKKPISFSSLPYKEAATQPTSSKVRMAKIKRMSITHSTSVTNLEAFSASLTLTSQTEDQLDNIYDSDFSQGSQSSTPSPPDPSLLALIPDEMFHPPTIPANLLWHCPIGGGTCSYTIDLCAPSAANLRSINTIVSQAQNAIHLLEKQWKSEDKQLRIIFFKMVKAHWDDHLKELDIRHVHQGDASYFEWVNPQRHALWPPQKWKLMKAHREQQLKSELKPEESPEL